ncbi:uncharacterized protein FIBRA_02336 [Fibroporia radiculosa]|uniref:Peptidase M48 domain-containing protein n=1 Tax=Fibroporia radiculosa TaxID=599839 RepID=J4I902_9APHY|nr:uncharacterized protein FIBRA_02336 [Fibroporia radiculosa]CCM00306.1 predicted protein [Fibroporia radiculosa]
MFKLPQGLKILPSTRTCCGIFLRPRGPATSAFLRIPAQTISNPARQFSATHSWCGPRYVRFNVDQEHPFNVRKWDLGTRIVAAVVVGGGVYYVTQSLLPIYLFAICVRSLEKVPETGRWRFMDVNPKIEAKLAKVSYEELLSEYQGKILPEHHPLTRHVRRVVSRILEASNLGTLAFEKPGYLVTTGPSDDLWSTSTQTADTPPGAGGRVWNLLVVNDDRMVNAMASYGNIVVFTGILPIAKDEQGLAAILGHEIGHVVLRHNSERYSSMKVLLALATLLEIAGLDFGFARLLTSLLYDLPNSRTQELEGKLATVHADHVGLKLASRACFDPRAAPEMFTRLGKLEQSKGGIQIGFISTHPPSRQRVQQLEELLPEAYAIQAASPECGAIQDSLAAFRDTFARDSWRAADENVVWT